MVDSLHSFDTHTFSNLHSADPHALNNLPAPASFLSGGLHGGGHAGGQLPDPTSFLSGGTPAEWHGASPHLDPSGATASGAYSVGAMATPMDAAHHRDGSPAYTTGVGEGTGHTAFAPRFGYAPREVNGHILSCTETSNSHHVSHPAGHTHHESPWVAPRFGSSGTRDWEGMHGNVYRTHDGGWTWNKIN